MNDRAVFDGSGGDRKAASGGDRKAASRGDRKAASGGDRKAASGRDRKAASGGDRGDRQKGGERPDDRRKVGARASRDLRKVAARSFSSLRRIPPAMRRFLAVVALAALAGLAALIVVSSESTTYERESSFAIRPSDTVAPAAVPDVVGTLSDPDNAVTESIVDILGSERLQDSAARAAGVSPDSVAASGADYSWLTTRRPGSTIVDLKITGPDRTKVNQMQTAAAANAASLVEANYSVYRLESLNAPGSADQVGSKAGQTVGLAVLLGALLGIGLLFAESKLRSSLGERTLDHGRDGRPPSDGNLTGDTDRLESTLRESLGAGASVRRVGPGRIEVAPPETAPDGAPPEAAPDRETARRKR
jgi:hypothetical protein